MAASKGDAPAQAPPTSYVCTSGPPPFTVDDDGGNLEHFIHTGGRPSEGGTRAVRAGDHLAPGHALVLRYPQHFQPSNEPVDQWPEQRPDDETRKRREAEQRSLVSHIAMHARPVCARCGYEYAHGVILLKAPDELAEINALSALVDGDPDSSTEAWRIKYEHDAARKTAHERRVEYDRLEAACEAEHPTCPPGTPPMPEPDMPAVTRSLFHRHIGIRSAG